VGPSHLLAQPYRHGPAGPGRPFGLRIHIHAVVKVDESGNNYSGKYKAAVYSVSEVAPFDESVEVASEPES